MEDGIRMEVATREIQLKCLELLDTVLEICERHDIEYSLCGGSVVGAHLYGGCLPWDDDIDLMMTRENYNKFLSVAQKHLPEHISIHNYQLSNEFDTPFTKLMDDNTTVVQQDGTICGVFLDITVYDRVPLNWRFNIDILLWKISQVVMIGKVSVTGFKQKLRNIALESILSNKRSYLCFFQKQVEKLGKTNNYGYAELFGAFCNTKRYPADLFENYGNIEFEGRDCRIVRDYVRYLELRYERTDFREPKEKQVAPHYQYVNLNLPYREYSPEMGVE